MCLDVVYRGKQKREAIAKLPEKFPVWKVCTKRNGKYYPWVIGEYDEDYRLFAGRQKAKSDLPSCGFHAFLTKETAERFATAPIIECVARRRDIRQIGHPNWLDSVGVVLSYCTFPKKCGQRPRKRGKR